MSQIYDLKEEFHMKKNEILVKIKEYIPNIDDYTLALLARPLKENKEYILVDETTKDLDGEGEDHRELYIKDTKDHIIIHLITFMLMFNLAENDIIMVSKYSENYHDDYKDTETYHYSDPKMAIRKFVSLIADLSYDMPGLRKIDAEYLPTVTAKFRNGYSEIDIDVVTLDIDDTDEYDLDSTFKVHDDEDEDECDE